jgi:hypothetical protein
MSPAFSSTRQAGAYALLLLLILLLPVLAGKWLFPTREQFYSASGRDMANFPYYHQQIFEEKGDIDIAFLSSSRMGCAIDPAYVQEKLSEKLGRQAVVRSITWSWNGYDALYFIGQDLLHHRKVRMIVFCDLSPDTTDIAHHHASRWFRFGDNAEALAGLPLESKASFYASAILGLPRNLAGLVRGNLAAIPSNKPDWNTFSTDFTPHTTVGPSDVRIYSEATKESFRFAGAPLPKLQREFVRKIGLLARTYQSQLVLLNIPDLADKNQPLLEENAYWPDAFGTDVPMVGIPPAILFAGMNDDEVGKLYFNYNHFDQNGKNYFTPLITPSLIQVYEDRIKP